MNLPPYAIRPALGLTLGLALGLVSSGCLAYKVVSAPVKIAAQTVVVAGDTAGAVVTGTGKVAVSAVRATGNITSSGIDACARLAQTGMVTFSDTTSGTVVRVPWNQGLTLASASDTAKVKWAQRAVKVVRSGRVAYRASRMPAGDLALLDGDVVQIEK